ncbi:hypothetical protein CF162_03610 [Parabacteroides distasonis]|nr:hypothetical protein CF162_03610 [Parabacteroides distasonis]
MGMILRIASSRIVGQGDIVGRSGYFSLNLSANSVMRGRLDARRTLKSLVADLRIMEIDEDNYSYALVGSNTSDYLWLLSRTPTLPEEAILFLLTKAKERGYNTSMLKWVKQKHENQK